MSSHTKQTYVKEALVCDRGVDSTKLFGDRFNARARRVRRPATSGGAKRMLDSSKLMWMERCPAGM